MPFRDVNELNRRPAGAERWLRRIFVEDWNLKLLALAITLILWFVVSGHDAEREVTVQPRIEGTPAASYELKGITVTPNQVRVQGPASSANAADLKAFTERISIDGRRDSFDVSHSPIHTSDSKVEALETVNIHVDIAAAGNQKPKS